MNHTFDRDPSTEMATEVTVRREAALSHNEQPDNRGRLTERRHDRLKWIVPVHTLSGVILGILILHPVTMVIYCYEFHPELTQSGVLHLVVSRMGSAFMPQMWLMTGAFALIGGLFGMGSGLYARAITRKLLLVSQLDRKLGMTIHLLIASGESDVVEFKSSLRWDHRQKKCNKALEIVIVKTIAGFLNHDGGDLLVGVADDGSIVGLEDDYATLRKKDRDGFELLLMQLVKNALGGEGLPHVRVRHGRRTRTDAC
ncbi:helix-turn-helix domain-containing protein [Gimesia sp.]|uniref:AlbA family DNA-binding domain-containing protein n=1 Tax=Gimesia sp. TaxID=2024833 RepID=UPI003A8F74CE